MFIRVSYVNHFKDSFMEKDVLSSADLMTRNLANRVEIAFPIYDEAHKERISQILSIYLMDNVKAREQDQNGCYSYVEKSQGKDEI